MSNSGDAGCYAAFHPHLIIVDEATRAVEPDMWNILGNYAKTPLVLIGDEAQLRPVVMSTLNENGFMQPLRVSFFQRLKMLGHPSVLFKIQYRMVAPVGTMISTLFYRGRLINGAGTALASRPLSQDHCVLANQIQGPLPVDDPQGPRPIPPG